MDNQLTIADTDEIFATGVFLQPVNCIINGKPQWRWIAIGFEDDSYFNGERIDTCDYAENLEGLTVEHNR